MISCKLDWLSFTFKTSEHYVGYEEFDYFLDAFPEIDALWEDCQYIEDLGRSKFYDHVYRFFGKMTVSFREEQFNGKQQADRNMGVNVNLPASSLQWFFDLMHYDMNDVPSALADLRKRGCSFSRLDFAFDDYDKIFNPEDFARFWLNNQIISDFRFGRLITSTQHGGGCFYLGKRSANRMMRVYDKDFESKGKIPAIRYEFEYHAQHTPALVDYIIEYGLPNLQAFLSAFIIRVVTPGTYESKHDRKDLDDWLKFLDLVQPSFNAEMPILSVTNKEDTKDQLISTQTWASNYTFSTIHSLCVIYGTEKVFKAILDSELSHKHTLLQALHDSDPEHYDKAMCTAVSLGKDYSSFW